MIEDLSISIGIEYDVESAVELKSPDAKATQTYEFKELSITQSGQGTCKRTRFTDPEVTRIKRQRANLTHKIMLERMREYLAKIGSIAFENEHIDLYAELPSQDKYVFEAKSLTDQNLLSQARKGLSQLYEYRYRYQDVIGYDVNLCLVFPE